MSCSYNASNSESLRLNATPTSSSELGGATVRGEKSDQKFSDIHGIEFESHATILKLKIVNGELNTAPRYCSGCGRKRKHNDKYCSNCGVKY